MKNSYYETLDKNFNEALNLLEGEFSHGELISMLEKGNIPQKQFAALQLDSINKEEEALILLQNLVGQDGKIREAVSLKIRDFAYNPDYLKLFCNLDTNKLSEYFLAAIVDVNGNICRNILDVLKYFCEDKSFAEMFTAKLENLTFELLDKVKNFDIQDGKYKVNKEIFKLYWCLESLNICFDKIDLQTLKSILKQAKAVDEYTIREKTAKILSNDINDTELLSIREELKNDKNYYVRRV